MARGNEHTARSCKYAGHTSAALSSRYGCPAEAAVRFANSVIARFSGEEVRLADIEQDFPDYVAHELRRLLVPVTAVFWSPRREKLTYAEAQRQLKTLSLSEDGAWQDKLNELLVLLNGSYHSGTFLHLIEKLTTKGQSRCFEIAPEESGIRFTALAQDGLDHDSLGPDDDLRVECASIDAPSLSKFSADFKRHWLGRLCNNNASQAAEELRSYLDRWSHCTPHLMDILAELWTESASTHDRNALIAEGRRALPHFALMCLFMFNNGSSSASYFLSPSIQGQYDSSMVIYWGPRATVPRPFVYLLSMLLGLNASPILQSMTRQRVLDAAFRNAGHTMRNRCDGIAQYFEVTEPRWHRDFRQELATSGSTTAAFGPEAQLDREYDKAWITAHTLPETFLALQLWGYASMEEFFGQVEPYKRNRFLTYDASPVDLLQRLGDWRPLAVSRRHLVAYDAVFDVYANLITDELNAAHLVPSIADPESGTCRLADDVLCAIFYELMRNATQHGLAYVRHESDDIESRRAFVDIHCARRVVEGHQTLVLYNDPDLDDPGKRRKWLACGEYNPVADDLGRGPGLVAGVLRNLKLGNIWSAQHGLADGCPTFAVAVWLKDFDLR